MIKLDEKNIIDSDNAVASVAQQIALPSTLPIFYGSEMGNAELVADNLKDAFEAAGVSVECVELNDQPVEELAEMTLALFVTSTSGEGDMPYTADRFWKHLNSEEAPQLPNLKYAVLALGDSGYTYFCGAGVSLDERLAELGATRIADRVECDVNYDAPANAWIAERVEQLSGANGAVKTVDTDVPTPSPTLSSPKLFATSLWTRENPFEARFLKGELLTQGGSAKEIRHYEMDISGSDIPYRPGDSVAVIPTNSDAAVDNFLKVLGTTGEEVLNGTTLRQLATTQWELRFPTSALLDVVANRLPSCELASALAGGDRAAGEEWIRTHGVCETLALLPAPLSLEELHSVMGPIRYRAYSIASTPRTHPNTVHLTVATQRNTADDALLSGVGSGYLADMLAPGDTVRIFPLPNRAFHLPDDPSIPIIMVGPGVGLAPFRSFLFDRAQHAERGSSWLFYGDQHESTDFIYREELEKMLEVNILSRLDTAFSRDQERKIYVQDRMREHGEDIVDWLRNGAYFYVCGDGKRMAADVDAVLLDLAKSSLGDEQGTALIEQLHHEKRYLRDVY